MLKRILKYFEQATNDDTLAASCFVVASERFFNLKYLSDLDLSKEELRYAGLRICEQVKLELID